MTRQPGEEVHLILARNKMVYYQQQGLTQKAALNHAIRFLITNGYTADKARKMMAEVP